MDIFRLTKSKTRIKILELFFAIPLKGHYLRELEKILSISAANIRRELLSLVKSGLFTVHQKGRLVYYRLNANSPLYSIIKSSVDKSKANSFLDIIDTGLLWITEVQPPEIPQEFYCQTRDVFSARLLTLASHLEETQGEDAYLITAVAGEIGNNSFDHNLGNWPDIPGIFFGGDEKRKIIVLADRGQGIFKTISRVKPDVENDKEALHVAFTQTISGRSPEKRGNGLKFVVQVIRDKKWRLRFDSGRATLAIINGQMKINEQKRNIKGCFAVISY